MTTKNILTVIGGACLAASTPLIQNAPNNAIWWIGTILASIGGLLVGTRGIGK